jgi:O-methyltransferase
MKVPQVIARPGVRAARYFFDQFGFELIEYKPHLKPSKRPIRDIEYYRPMFNPWLAPEWKERLRAADPRSLLSLHAKYVFYTLALDATRRCSGEVAECGVYKGGTAKILAQLVPDRPVYLFDTFAGMPEIDPSHDLVAAGDFGDTDIDSVRRYLADHKNVTCVQGLIPGSLDVIRDRTFAFVHIDLDIYAAILAACEFFYPRMQPGGILLFDDYGHPHCPGARDAVDEFFADKREVKIVNETAQCSVQKI